MLHMWHTVIILLSMVYNNVVMVGPTAILIKVGYFIMHGKRRTDGAQFRSDSQPRDSYTSNWPYSPLREREREYSLMLGKFLSTIII